MSEVTCNTNKCNWSNSFSVNALGTLDNVLECETCGKRDYQTNRQRPEHLKNRRLSSIPKTAVYWVTAKST